MDTMSMKNQSLSAKDSLDLSGKMLDRFFAADDSFPTLVEKMQINKNSQYLLMLLYVFGSFIYFLTSAFSRFLGQSVSGCTEYDYPKEELGMSSITPLKSKHKVPLPGALLEQWNGIIFNFILLSYFLFFFETLIKCVICFAQCTIQ